MTERKCKIIVITLVDAETEEVESHTWEVPEGVSVYFANDGQGYKLAVAVSPTQIEVAKVGHVEIVKTGPEHGQQIMPHQKGVRFYCEVCNGGVFTQLDGVEGGRMACNNCKATYEMDTRGAPELN